MTSKSATDKRSDSYGTVVITGANGSLGQEFVRSLLQKYPEYVIILGVRDESNKDENTNKLREIISNFGRSKCYIEVVDLSLLASVRSFADSMIERVSTGRLPPISAIVCNAFNWSLIGQQNSADGFDLGFQVTHLSHFLLVLELIGSMDKENGRIVLLGSEAHDGQATNSMRPLGAAIPDDLEQMVKPKSDNPGEEQARGFQRYGSAKLANIMFMFMLNRKLQEDPALRNITALAMDPGGMPSSRAFDNVPPKFKAMMSFVSRFVVPIAKHFTSTISTPADAGRNLVEISVGPEHKGARGYFLQQRSLQTSAESQDEIKQEKLWAVCEKWVNLEASETVLK